MMQLGRGMVDGMSPEIWARLDQRIFDCFKAAVVCGRGDLWAPRIVPLNTPSSRIGGKDVALTEESSDTFVHDTQRESDGDLELRLVRAAQLLAIKEDVRVLSGLVAGARDVKVPKSDPHDVMLRAFVEAETELRKSVTNDELVVLVSPALHAELDSKPFAHSTLLGHLEKRLGSSFLRTRALPHDKVWAVLTTHAPQPIEIVRSDQPRLAVTKVEGGKVTFKVVMDVAVGASVVNDVVIISR